MNRAKVFCALSVVLCALSASAVYGQNCTCGARVVQHAPTYAPHYAANTAYVAPVAQHHANVYQNVVGLKEVFYIPTPVPVPVATDFSFSVRDTEGEKRERENDRQRIVDEVVARLTQALKVSPQNPPAPSASIPPGSVPLTAPPAAKGPPAGHEASAKTKKIFSDRCTRCHGDGGVVKGNLNLTNSTALTLGDWWACAAQCKENEMPKDDKPLTADETAAIYADAKAAAGKVK